jgi:hypothetical protein
MDDSYPTLRIASVGADACLEFSEVEGDCFRVAVTAHDHSASRTADAYTDRAGIPRLLAAAARDWRGWDGVREWSSICGEFRIALTMDRLGHVRLDVRVQSEIRGIADEWQLDAAFSLEAGQLERLAKEAARLWRVS